MKIGRIEFIKSTAASSFAVTLPSFATEKKDGAELFGHPRWFPKR